MIQLTPHLKIFIAVNPADFRCGIDKLARLSSQIFSHDPKSGVVFVFKNRPATAIKLLFYDGTGFWLCHKRFSAGKLKWWPNDHKEGTTIDANKLMVVLWNGNPNGVFEAPWRRIESVGDNKKKKENHRNFRGSSQIPRGAGPEEGAFT